MSAKTQKRSSNDTDDLLTGGGGGAGSEIGATSGNQQLDKILTGGATDAYKRPWHRLERGLRLNRLRLFVADEAKQVNLSDAESMQLFALLQKSLEKKFLNSKTTVIYDSEEQKIKEIKGLVSHRDADGVLRYKFIEKRAAVTMRRKRGEPSAAATAE